MIEQAGEYGISSRLESLWEMDRDIENFLGRVSEGVKIMFQNKWFYSYNFILNQFISFYFDLHQVKYEIDIVIEIERKRRPVHLLSITHCIHSFLLPAVENVTFWFPIYLSLRLVYKGEDQTN